jgi:hypothetical protein
MELTGLMYFSDLPMPAEIWRKSLWSTEQGTDPRMLAYTSKHLFESRVTFIDNMLFPSVFLTLAARSSLTTRSSLAACGLSTALISAPLELHANPCTCQMVLANETARVTTRNDNL